MNTDQYLMLMCSAEMWSRSCDLAVTLHQQMRHCSWNWHHCGMSLWSRLRMLPNMLLCRLHWWCRHLTTSCRFCTLFAVITITVVILKSRYWWWTVKCWPNGCSMPFMGVMQAERINLVVLSLVSLLLHPHPCFDAVGWQGICHVIIASVIIKGSDILDLDQRVTPENKDDQTKTVYLWYSLHHCLTYCKSLHLQSTS